MQTKARTKSRGSSFPVLLIPVALVVIGLILFAVFRGFGSKSDPCAETVARLEAMEAADVSQVEADLDKVIEAAAAEEVDSLQEQILSGEAILDNVAIRQAFSGTAIIGDSITESIWEYGYLDQDVVVSHRGLSVANADEQIDTAISLSPYVVFMAFGSNDLETYEENYTPFIDAYRIPIYINLILPIQQSAIDERPALSYYPEYNEALKSLCSETGCTYIDNSFITQDNQELYEPDGEHVIMEYYPKWLSYMAAIAGLV